MINSEEKLRRIAEYRAAHRASSNITSLGDVLSGMVGNRISPRQARYEMISEAWNRLLPDELFKHCRIVDINGGRLEVSVDSAPYMYELQLLSRELTEELGRCCPRARVRKIKFTLG